MIACTQSSHIPSSGGLDINVSMLVMVVLQFPHIPSSHTWACSPDGLVLNTHDVSSQFFSTSNHFFIIGRLWWSQSSSLEIFSWTWWNIFFVWDIFMMERSGAEWMIHHFFWVLMVLYWRVNPAHVENVAGTFTNIQYSIIIRDNCLWMVRSHHLSSLIFLINLQFMSKSWCVVLGFNHQCDHFFSWFVYQEKMAPKRHTNSMN